MTMLSTHPFDTDYDELLATLSNGSVNRNFDPYLDIDWDSPELQIDPNDPRWVLHPEVDPLGATEWYQALPLDEQISIGRWRIANSIKVGASFESILIRGMMQYAMKLPNGSPEFRYCMHEMTEECNHIQMFQELVNRIGVDVKGPRPYFRALAPLIGVAGGYFHTILFIGILAGEEPIDHYQKAIIRAGDRVPPAVLRCMQIHIAEEARHISFAHEFLKNHIGAMDPVSKTLMGLAFPIAMRWLAGEIAAPDWAEAKAHGVDREAFKQAFWKAPHSQEVLAGFFKDVRPLVEEIGLLNPITRRVWSLLGIAGPNSRYRGEPERKATAAV
ncbi:AurF N-oxygenase family protein [Smaragdicoccus niigatensis]|uniref:AurF N-oxygenase family protein n=1 Tax=Smaragdicoccus niigatensis TaxID=359359 RepID=UPI00035FD87F|nr:diiron oxygenase [Smaragdicoccus niigatensis]